jgi:hypothetical protein
MVIYMYAASKVRPGTLPPLSDASIFKKLHNEFCNAVNFSTLFSIKKIEGLGGHRSSSRTVIVFADYVGSMTTARRKSVVMKFFISNKVLTTESSLNSQNRLVAEYNIYKLLVEQRIFKDGNGANFVRPIYGFVCNDQLIADMKTNTNRQVVVLGFELEKLKEDKTGAVVCTITEHRPSSSSLEDYILNHNITTRDFVAIVFQIIHALYICEIYKLQHNDLHLGNILVDTAPVENEINYKCYDSVGGEHKFTIDIAGMAVPAKIMLFDWDYGTSELHRNAGLSSTCQSEGRCPTFQPGFDIYVFIRKLELYMHEARMSSHRATILTLSRSIIKFNTPAERKAAIKQSRECFPCMDASTDPRRVLCVEPGRDNAQSLAARSRFEMAVLRPGDALKSLKDTLFSTFVVGDASRQSGDASRQSGDASRQSGLAKTKKPGSIGFYGSQRVASDIYFISGYNLYRADKLNRTGVLVTFTTDKHYRLIAPPHHPSVYVLFDKHITCVDKKDYSARKIDTDANGMELLTFHDRKGDVMQYILLSTPNGYRYGPVDLLNTIKNTDELLEILSLSSHHTGELVRAGPKYRVLGAASSSSGINYVLASNSGDASVHILTAKLTDGFLEIYPTDITLFTGMRHSSGMQFYEDRLLFILDGKIMYLYVDELAENMIKGRRVNAEDNFFGAHEFRVLHVDMSPSDINHFYIEYYPTADIRQLQVRQSGGARRRMSAQRKS